MSRHTWIVGLILLVLGCSVPVDGARCDENGCGEAVTGLEEETDDMHHHNKVASFTADMVRTTAVGTTAAPGLPNSSFVNSLQVNNLVPGEYTLQFEALPPADGKGFSAYAIVRWKVKGQQITRKVSVYSGAAISGVAEAVDVSLVDVSNINLGPLTAAPYQIATNLTPGGRGVTMQPPTLLTRPNTTTIAAQSVQSYSIPQGAGVISAMVLAAIDNAFVAAAPTTEIAVLARDQAGVNLAAWYPNAQSPGWVPLPGNAVELLVVNKNATAGVQCQVIWGVEG